MSVAHYTANSLAEFVEQICKIKNSLRQNGAEFNEVSLFRGQADESYELLPSLARPIISESSESLIHEERNLIEMAKFRLPSIFQESMRPLERLALYSTMVFQPDYLILLKTLLSHYTLLVVHQKLQMAKL